MDTFGEFEVRVNGKMASVTSGPREEALKEAECYLTKYSEKAGDTDYVALVEIRVLRFILGSNASTRLT